LTRTEHKPGHYFFGEWKDLAIVVWLASADENAAARMAEFTGRTARQWHKFSIVHVIEEGAGIPTRGGRDGIVATGRAHRENFACAGALLLQSGILATLMLAFLRGVRTLIRGGADIRIEEDVATLATWMAPRHSARTGTQISMAELSELIAEARGQAIGEPPAGRAASMRPIA
jgi:hypothetical protein